MNKSAIAVGAILLWGGMEVLLRGLGGNPYTDQVIRAAVGLVVSLGFAVQIGRLTEVRWGILLAIVFIFTHFLLWVNNFFVVGYFVWAGWRLSSKRTIELTGEPVMGERLGDFFARVRLWELALWMALSLAVGLVAGMWSGWVWLADDKLGTEVFDYVAEGLIAFWLLGKLEGAGLDLDGFIGRWPQGRLIGEGLLVALALAMVGNGMTYGLVYVIAGFDPALAENALKHLAWQPAIDKWWLETFIGTVVFAPIVEELIFRGVVLRRLAAIWGNTAAILVSALVFGLLHGWELAAAMTVAGIGFAVLYARSHTLVVPIAAHMANNLAAFLMIVFYPGQAPVTLAQLQTEMPWDLLLAGVSLPVLAMYFYKYWPRGSWVRYDRL